MSMSCRWWRWLGRISNCNMWSSRCWIWSIKKIGLIYMTYHSWPTKWRLPYFIIQLCQFILYHWQDSCRCIWKVHRNTTTIAKFSNTKYIRKQCNNKNNLKKPFFEKQLYDFQHYYNIVNPWEIEFQFLSTNFSKKNLAKKIKWSSNGQKFQNFSLETIEI